MTRKLISTLALTLCVLMTVFCFAACGNSGNSDTSDSGKSTLVGTWESVEAPGTAYIFNDDGTGALDASGTKLNFTYEDKGASVEIAYEGTSSADVYEYTIEGSKLSMTDTGTSTVYTYTKK